MVCVIAVDRIAYVAYTIAVCISAHVVAPVVPKGAVVPFIH